MTDITGLLADVLRGDRPSRSLVPVEPALLVDGAEQHGVAALVWTALCDLDGGAAAWRGVRDALDGYVRAAAARELLVRRELRTALSALGAAGVRPLVVKGAALAYTVYPEPWLRPRTDTDLLVHSDQVDAAVMALEALGYARTDALTSGTFVSAQAALERTDDLGLRHVIDLHWKLANPQLLSDALPFDQLWNEARDVAALGPAARAPSAVDSLLLACMHRLAHHQGHDRLVWLYDIRLVAGTFSPRDWCLLEQRAVARRVAGLCLDGLRHASESLGGCLPPSTAEALGAAAPSEPSRSYIEKAVHRRDVLVSDLALLPTWSDRLRLLREHAFPPPAFIRQRYGVHSSIWLPALYMHRLVTGARKWVRH